MKSSLCIFIIILFVTPVLLTKANNDEITRIWFGSECQF